MLDFCEKLNSIAKQNNIEVISCAESIYLSACGINHNSCIDRALIEKIIGYEIKVDKDKNQRDVLKV